MGYNDGKINKLNRFVKKNNDFIRRFTAGVKVVDIDSLGRVLIPKDLISFGSIPRKSFFFRCQHSGNWDKDLYETSINGEDVDFADLAEEVMGNINDDDNGIS
jgi:MraZ protein